MLLLVDEPATSIVKDVIFDVVIIAHPDPGPDPKPDPEAITSDEEETADSIHPFPLGLELEDSKVDS